MQKHSHWVILALTWLLCSGLQADEATRLQCDDPDVHDAVALVLFAHNKELTEGNQLALYQVTEAAKAQNESGQFLSVNFTARESDCAAGGEKAWLECDYLQDSSKLLRHCRASVQLKEANEVAAHHCSVEPTLNTDPRPQCLGCPESISVDSEDIKEPLIYSIFKANKLNEHTHHFLLNTVAWVTRQVIAGFRYRLQFDMQKSNCTKEDFDDITEVCHPDPTEPAFINCNSTVDVAPWRHELPDTSVSCETGMLQATIITRRRPPGWSPLRSVYNFYNKQNKDKSSEESQEGKKLTATDKKSQNPTADLKPIQPTAVVLTPSDATSFTCPGKPWKDFVAVAPLPYRPPPPPPRPDSNHPEQAGFTDLDLIDIISE